MPKYVVVVFLILCISTRGAAQQVDIKLFIEAWSASDTSQTHKAEATYTVLKKHHDVGMFRQITSKMYAYLKGNPDDRLWVRTTMFDVFGKIELGVWKKEDRPKEAARILNCIKIASKLNDDQLMAELYAQYAEVSPNSSNYVLYNLKAIALQKKVGISHFVFVANRYYNVGYGLYINEDFKQSINYGLNYLSFDNKVKRNEDPQLYVMINDVIGASYFELNNADSAQFYYREILDTLQKKPLPDPERQQLWQAIAKGNIGRSLAMNEKIDQATPLIEEYLQTSLGLGFFNNAAIAENILGAIYMKRMAYEKAKIAFRNAYIYAAKESILKETVIASKGLADAFRATNITDSAFKYYELHQQYRSRLTEKINGGKLSAIRASIAFDNMDESLQAANKVIQVQRLNRNFILGVIALLTVIALLFYNRKMLQQRNLAATLAYKQKILAQEAAQAKGEVKNFIENIANKNKLIESLQRKLTKDNEQINESLLKYTLVTDAEWERFRLEFSKAYPIFLPALNVILPSINPGEERLAALLCLKITINEIANMLGISKDSVGRSKRRLKQRLNVDTEISLEDFICELA